MTTSFRCAILIVGCIGAPAQAESLLDVYLLAQHSDARLQEAEAHYQAVARGKSIAWGDLLPQIAFEYSTGETRQSLQGTRTGSGGGRDRFTSRSDRLTLSQTLFRRDLYVELDRADAHTARALAQRDAVRQELIVRTAQAYFDVLSAQDRARFAQKEKDATELQLEQAEARFQVGLAAIVEVKETRASYDLATAREIEARNLLENQREALTVITGQPHQLLQTLSDRFRPARPDPEDIQQWTDAALEHNLEYRIRKRDLEVAKHTVQYEKAKHWPTLDLFANLDDNEDTGGVFSQDGSRLKSDRISIQLKVPILTGGKTYFRTRQARFEEEEARARLLAARRQTEQRARSAYRDVTAGVSRVQAFKRALESAEVDLEANQAGLEAGIRDTVDVVEAISRRYAAERDYSQARYDYLVDRLRLRQASGQLSLEDVEWINYLLD